MQIFNKIVMYYSSSNVALSAPNSSNTTVNKPFTLWLEKFVLAISMLKGFH